MSDIIDHAFNSHLPHHWDDFRVWLRTHARNVNHVEDLITYAQDAEGDGIMFPSSPDEVRNILKKYDAREWFFP